MKPPIAPGHRVSVSGPAETFEATVLAIHPEADMIWLQPRADMGCLGPPWPETYWREDLTSLEPDIHVVELTPEQQAQVVERDKLIAVRNLIGVMDKANPEALQAVLGRLTKSFESDRLLPGYMDTGTTPQEDAQGLLVSVLMSAITVRE